MVLSRVFDLFAVMGLVMLTFASAYAWQREPPTEGRTSRVIDRARGRLRPVCGVRGP